MRSLKYVPFFLLVFLCLQNLSCHKSDQTHTQIIPDKVQSQKVEKSQYPAHWWKEVPRDQGKSWEVLPQDAGPGEVILSKRNELGLLSNFAETSFVFKNKCYPNVEALWQMMKYPDNELNDDPRFKWASKWKYNREQVQTLNGYAAKAAGNYANDLMEQQNANWVSFEGHVFPFAEKTPGEHYKIILEVLSEKLRQNPEVLNVLLQTGNLILKPDHHISSEAPREWFYNLLWMDLRLQLQKKEFNLETPENLTLKNCVGKKYVD